MKTEREIKLFRIYNSFFNDWVAQDMTHWADQEHDPGVFDKCELDCFMGAGSIYAGWDSWEFIEVEERRTG